MNLLEETIEEIKESGHTIDDVMFVGSKDGKYRLNFEDFSIIANKEYDSGYGGQEVAYDLMVYFKDFSYLLREEYDGAEWWKYYIPKKFKEDDDYEKYSKVFVFDNEEKCNGWNSLREINDYENDE